MRRLKERNNLKSCLKNVSEWDLLISLVMKLNGADEAFLLAKEEGGVPEPITDILTILTICLSYF